MNYAKPEINKYLTINHFGQLIQWRDDPEIVDGLSRDENIIVKCLPGCAFIPWYQSIEFTIVKNQFKGL